jgi:carboxymethylenebutenolidase
MRSGRPEGFTDEGGLRCRGSTREWRERVLKAETGSVAPEMSHVRVASAGEEMAASLVRPSRTTGPGVVIAHDASGVIPFYLDLAVRIAASGYVAVLPDLYFREGPLEEASPEAEMARLSTLDKKRSVRDLLAAADWLKGQPGVEGARVGVVGCSLGATLALDMTADRADLVVASFYPFPLGEVPAGDNSPPAPISEAWRMHGPIIAFWGAHDEVVAMDDAARLGSELTRHGVDFTYTIYPGVGHSFLRASELMLGRDTSEAALDAWARTLELFHRKLRSSA